MATLRAVWLRVGLIAALVVSQIWVTAWAIAFPRAEVGRLISDDRRLTKDEHIAAWFEQRAQPRDQVDALCAGAGLYGNLSIVAPFTYLWFDNVRSVPGAEDALAEMLSSEHRPRFVAEHQSPASCDPSGRTAELLRKHYRRSTTIDGISILEATTET